MQKQKVFKFKLRRLIEPKFSIDEHQAVRLGGTPVGTMLFCRRLEARTYNRQSHVPFTHFVAVGYVYLAILSRCSHVSPDRSSILTNSKQIAVSSQRRNLYLSHFFAAVAFAMAWEFKIKTFSCIL